MHVGEATFLGEMLRERLSPVLCGVDLRAKA